jgi:hypothetical protein
LKVERITQLMLKPIAYLEDVEEAPMTYADHTLVKLRDMRCHFHILMPLMASRSSTTPFTA